MDQPRREEERVAPSGSLLVAGAALALLLVVGIANVIGSDSRGLLDVVQVGLPTLGLLGFVLEVRRRRPASEPPRAPESRGTSATEAVGRLAGGIAHDFNNLLTVIRLNVELLRDDLRGQVDALEAIEQVDQAAERAAELTGRLLAYSRQQVLRIEVFDANEAVRDVAAASGALLGPNVELDLELTEGLPPVRADRAQVEHAVTQLLTNAREGIDEAGRVRMRTARAPDADGFVRIEVEDDGRGMDRETLGRVFEPFFTTKAFGQGSGLGLCTVQGVVRQLGGDVEIHSEAGVGTTVSVDLPLAITGDLGPQPVPPPTPTTDSPRPARVLVAEDEVAVRHLVERVLGRSGHQVISVESGEAAWSILTSGRTVDVLLSDISMLGMDGVTLARRVREAYPQTAVILMTGHTGRTADLASDDLPVVHKPFTADEIQQAVAEALEGRFSPGTE